MDLALVVKEDEIRHIVAKALNDKYNIEVNPENLKWDKKNLEFLTVTDVRKKGIFDEN